MSKKSISEQLDDIIATLKSTEPAVEKYKSFRLLFIGILVGLVFNIASDYAFDLLRETFGLFSVELFCFVVGANLLIISFILLYLRQTKRKLKSIASKALKELNKVEKEMNKSKRKYDAS